MADTRSKEEIREDVEALKHQLAELRTETDKHKQESQQYCDHIQLLSQRVAKHMEVEIDQQGTKLFDTLVAERAELQCRLEQFEKACYDKASQVKAMRQELSKGSIHLRPLHAIIDRAETLVDEGDTTVNADDDVLIALVKARRAYEKKMLNDEESGEGATHE